MASPSPAPATTTRPSRRTLGALLAAAALGAALLWIVVHQQRQYGALARQLERTEVELRTVREQAAQTQAALERLTTEFKDAQSNAAALDSLVADLTRGSDELALLEVERLLTLAAQDLQFGGDVPGALAAVAAADARLARNETARLAPLRRAIVRDLERLRAVPAVDYNGIALKLDQLAQGADDWPLLAQVEAGAAQAETAAPRPAPPPAPSGWQRLKDWLNAEFGELVRVREAATPEALLLNPTQQQLARQQFKLRLLAARLALDARDGMRFRADLAQAQALLARYFDAKAPAVAAAAAQFKQIAATALRVDLPNVNDSLNAVRALRPAAPR
jgi:uroporphyrin-3 C-methyltransferase